MGRLKIEDLYRVKGEILRSSLLKSGKTTARVTVHMGTCGISSGADKILEILNKAKKIGEDRGLKHVYLGNVYEDAPTLCHGCGKRLISRSIFLDYKMNIKDGKCKFCNSKIPGIWE